MTPQKRGYTTPAPALDLTTSLRGDLGYEGGGGGALRLLLCLLISLVIAHRALQITLCGRVSYWYATLGCPLWICSSSSPPCTRGTSKCSSNRACPGSGNKAHCHGTMDLCAFSKLICMPSTVIPTFALFHKLTQGFGLALMLMCRGPEQRGPKPKYGLAMLH